MFTEHCSANPLIILEEVLGVIFNYKPYPKKNMSNGDSSSSGWKKIVIFGDSLTQRGSQQNGWVNLLSNSMIRKCDVINRGLSGYNTRWALQILPEVLKDSVFSNQFRDVLFFVIFLGANDAEVVGSTMDGLKQGVHIDEYEKNIFKIIETLQQAGLPKEKIVVFSPPACNEDVWTNTRKNSLVKIYAQRACELAQELGLICVNLHEIFMKDNDWKSLLNDGLHLSERGNFLVFELMNNLAENYWTGSSMAFPDWVDFSQKQLK